ASRDRPRTARPGRRMRSAAAPAAAAISTTSATRATSRSSSGSGRISDRESKGHATTILLGVLPGPERGRRGLDTTFTAVRAARGRAPVKVTVLGSGDAFGSGGRWHSAYLVESASATFLLDCGPTILQSLKSAGYDTGRIDFVLVSHLHG